MGKILKLIFIMLVFTGCGTKENNYKIQYFPQTELKPKIIPDKENIWVFILAGQSNMAGYGLVEPQDTIPNERIFSINRNGELIVAKEPLHFYEPSKAGLDCGLSFGKELLNYIPDSISVLLIPAAVGSTSINQWINDSTFKNLTLFSNFVEKAKTGEKYGVIKGILWHQGESDATNVETVEVYQFQLAKLVEKFRIEINNLTLPILIGELGTFSNTNESWQAINNQIHSFAKTDSNVFVIKTNDLKDIGDKVHFNSEGQRQLGQRFAKEFVKRQNYQIN
ncbi:sialate O-acetylesterase [bacterium]|nr:sialate O-acetylesterase [bacterium]